MDTSSDIRPRDDDAAIDNLRSELAKAEPTRRKRMIDKFVSAVLGSIPWVGGFLSAAASYRADAGTVKQDSLQNRWLEEHQTKISSLKQTLSEIERRFEALGSAIDERVQSESYLAIVRKAFRAWDNADTFEKRKYAANLVINAAGTRVCSDDVLRLFLDWLETYHEAHFSVIRHVSQNPGSTKYDIWLTLYGELPREDSAEADLFKLLVRDLTIGGVLRQERDVNQLGEYVRKTAIKTRRGDAPTTMESAFEGTKPHVLTGLGQQFVHYTMNEAVTRIEGPDSI